MLPKLPQRENDNNNRGLEREVKLDQLVKIVSQPWIDLLFSSLSGKAAKDVYGN